MCEYQQSVALWEALHSAKAAEIAANRPAHVA